MKSAIVTEIVETIQAAVTLAIKQWLDENRPDVLMAIQKGMAESKTLTEAGQFKVSQKKTAANDKTYLTPAQAAGRWGFHIESVRRMLRRDGWPVARIGRRIRIPVAFIERLEAESVVCPRRG